MLPRSSMWRELLHLLLPYVCFASPPYKLSIASIVPSTPIAPGLSYIGPALDLSVDEANARYGDNLNVSVIKAHYKAFTCEDMDSNALDFVARQFYRTNSTDSCMAVIGSGKH